MKRGHTLIELMIVVALLGIVLATWSTRSVLSAPGTPGHRALAVDRASELLVAAEQEAVLAPQAGFVGQGIQAIPSSYGEFRLAREVAQAAPGLLTLRFTATWTEPSGERQLTLVALKAEGP
ncbi:MAG: prepilin-type N-terminal cleavage/methylation domain-containing protein [Myxococcales bacterium]|nr:prepilin-type N-terminal cleavage/methylation domain-containing protein [Myxococcales bacterium]